MKRLQAPDEQWVIHNSKPYVELDTKGYREAIIEQREGGVWWALMCYPPRWGGVQTRTWAGRTHLVRGHWRMYGGRQVWIKEHYANRPRTRP